MPTLIFMITLVHQDYFLIHERPFETQNVIIHGYTQL
jgi:hypothetical protein